MWSGRTALKNIDQGMQTVRKEVVRLDDLLRRLSDSLSNNQRHRLKLINDIARVRIGEIKSGQLQTQFGAADQEVAQILEQRDQAIDNLNAEIEGLDKSIAEAEQAREMQLVLVNEQSQKLAELESHVQAQLKDDQAYLTQLSESREAESIADEAERKVALAQQDMQEKAKAYKQDKLFMYLWDLGFGTTEYRGGLFARFIDAWVARVIDYEPARVSFWNLTQIPQRLVEHASRAADIADERLQSLQQLEFDALQVAGAKEQERAIAAQREALDTLDDQLEASETSLNKLLQSRANYLAGEDDYMHRCLSRLAQVLDNDDLVMVDKYVRQTASPTDDSLVIELQSVDDRLDTVRDDLADVRNMHDKRIAKLQELELVRRNFKNARYDDVRSGFINEAVLATTLGQFLEGLASGSDLWRVMQRNQRYRNVGSLPDFGSGGIGRQRSGGLGDILGRGPISKRRRQRNSTWHVPRPRVGGGGGFRFPSGGGGGFKTDGGF